MKKIFLVLNIGIVLIFSGCSAIKSNANLASIQQEDAAKGCKIEVVSAKDDTLLKTIENKDSISKLVQTDEWKEVEEPPQNLIPEYKLIVYQEKTPLLGQDPAEKRDYEIIERITTFQDASYVELSISGDAIKNMKVPNEFLTLYYTVPEEVTGGLQQLLK